jgi:GPH family glycoside/pentoside/hexuronide:cation symporter
MREDQPERLTVGQLAIFSLPVLIFQAIEIPWRTYLPALFTQWLGLPLATVGTLLMAIRLFDMVADPTIGWASDRFATRFGLRRPWMAAAVPLVMLGTWQVYFAAPGIGPLTLAAWCLVLHLGYTMILTPHGGWGLEISSDYHERTRISAVKVWFGAAAMPLVVLLPSILERGFGAGRAEQVGAIGLLLLVLAPVSVMLVLRFIPEPPADRAAAARIPNPFGQIAVLLRDRELVTVLGLYTLVGVADASSAATFIFFVENTLSLAGWASTLILIQAVIALGALPLWLWVSRRLGKRRALIGVFAWQALSAPCALFLPAGALLPLALFLILRNACWGGDYMLLRAMVADISGRDAQRGLRRSGSYYALFNVTLRLAASLTVGLALWMLAGLGFSPGEAASQQALDAVRFVYALPAGIAGLVGAAVLLHSDMREPLMAWASPASGKAA